MAVMTAMLYLLLFFLGFESLPYYWELLHQLRLLMFSSRCCSCYLLLLVYFLFYLFDCCVSVLLLILIIDMPWVKFFNEFYLLLVLCYYLFTSLSIYSLSLYFSFCLVSIHSLAFLLHGSFFFSGLVGFLCFHFYLALSST